MSHDRILPLSLLRTLRKSLIKDRAAKTLTEAQSHAEESGLISVPESIRLGRMSL